MKIDLAETETDSEFLLDVMETREAIETAAASELETIDVDLKKQMEEFLQKIHQLVPDPRNLNPNVIGDIKKIMCRILYLEKMREVIKNKT